jgi:hypothetical protein
MSAVLKRAWSEELQPALTAVAEFFHGDLSAMQRTAKRNRLGWVMYISQLVKSDRGDVEECAKLLGDHFDEYVRRYFVEPIAALLPTAAAAADDGASSMTSFASPNGPVLPADIVGTETRAAIVQIVARELSRMRQWLAWVSVVFSYLDTVWPKYENGTTVRVMAASRLHEQIYDGLHPLLVSAVIERCAERRRAFARGELGADAGGGGGGVGSFHDVLTVVSLIANADLRRPDAPRRRGLEREKSEEEKAMEAQRLQQPWLVSSLPPPLVVVNRLDKTAAGEAVFRDHFLKPFIDVAVKECNGLIAAEVVASRSSLTLTQRLRRVDDMLAWESDQLRRILATQVLPQTSTPQNGGGGGVATATATGAASATVPAALSLTRGTAATGADPTVAKPIAELHAALLEGAVHPFALQLLEAELPLGAVDAAASPPSAGGPRVIPELLNSGVDGLALFARVLGRAPHVADGPSSLVARSIKEDVAARYRVALDAAVARGTSAAAAATAANSTGGTASSATAAHVAARRIVIAAFVEGVSDVWEHLRAVVDQPAIRKVTCIPQALKDSFRLQLHTCPVSAACLGPRAVPAAELLARYVDLCLRNSPETRLAGTLVSDDDLAPHLRPVASLLGLVTDKDVFVFASRQLLADRLLAGRPTDPEAAVLAVFKQECSEVREAELLLHDFVNASAFAADAIAALPTAAAADGFAFQPTIVSKAFWPPFAIVAYAPPPPVVRLMRYMDAAFHQKRRTLQWHVYAGRATVLIGFSLGTREVTGGLLAISALYHLNDDTLTISELAARAAFAAVAAEATAKSGEEEDATQTKDSEANSSSSSPNVAVLSPQLREVLLSFATVPKLVSVNDVPIASPAEMHAAITAADAPQRTIRLNSQFSAKSRKLELKAVLMKSGAPSGGSAAGASSAAAVDDAMSADAMRQLTERRRYATEAAATRVMKSRKELAVRELVEEVQRVLARAFSCPAKLVREAITVLIEREYLQRIDDSDPPAVRYLA